MANKQIIDLPLIGSTIANDYVPISRSGINYKVPVGSLPTGAAGQTGNFYLASNPTGFLTSGSFLSSGQGVLVVPTIIFGNQAQGTFSVPDQYSPALQFSGNKFTASINNPVNFYIFAGTDYSASRPNTSGFLYFSGNTPYMMRMDNSGNFHSDGSIRAVNNLEGTIIKANALYITGSGMNINGLGSGILILDSNLNAYSVPIGTYLTSLNGISNSLNIPTTGVLNMSGTFNSYTGSLFVLKGLTQSRYQIQALTTAGKVPMVINCTFGAPFGTGLLEISNNTSQIIMSVNESGDVKGRSFRLNAISNPSLTGAQIGLDSNNYLYFADSGAGKVNLIEIYPRNNPSGYISSASAGGVRYLGVTGINTSGNIIITGYGNDTVFVSGQTIIISGSTGYYPFPANPSGYLETLPFQAGYRTATETGRLKFNSFFVYFTGDFGAGITNQINTTNGTLTNGDAGNLSINWKQRWLQDANGNTSVAYATGLLINNIFGTVSVDWYNNLLQTGPLPNTVIDWGNLKMYDSTGFMSVKWNERQLVSSGANGILATGLDWNKQRLYDSGNKLAIDWTKRIGVNKFNTNIFSWTGQRFVTPNLTTDLLSVTTGQNGGSFNTGPDSVGLINLSGTTGVNVNFNIVTANTLIFLTIQSPSGIPGTPYVYSRSPLTSFTVKSSAGDLSTCGWMAVEPQTYSVIV